MEIQRESPQDIVLRTLSLSYLDSNQDRQNQKLQCYHYTIRQSYLLKCSAHLKRHKVRHVWGIIQIFLYFFIFFSGKSAGFSVMGAGRNGKPGECYALFWPERRKRRRLSRAVCAKVLCRMRRAAATDSMTALISDSGASSVSNSRRWSGIVRTASAL